MPGRGLTDSGALKPAVTRELRENRGPYTAAGQRITEGPQRLVEEVELLPRGCAAAAPGSPETPPGTAVPGEGQGERRRAPPAKGIASFRIASCKLF